MAEKQIKCENCGARCREGSRNYPYCSVTCKSAHLAEATVSSRGRVRTAAQTRTGMPSGLVSLGRKLGKAPSPNPKEEKKKKKTQVNKPSKTIASSPSAGGKINPFEPNWGANTTGALASEGTGMISGCKCNEGGGHQADSREQTEEWKFDIPANLSLIQRQQITGWDPFTAWGTQDREVAPGSRDPLPPRIEGDAAATAAAFEEELTEPLQRQANAKAAEKYGRWRLDFPKPQSSTGVRANFRWNVRVSPSRNQGGVLGFLKNGDEIYATSVEVAGTKGDPETWLRIEMPSAKQFGGGGWTVMEAQGGSWVAIGSETTKTAKGDANIVVKARMGRPPLSSMEKIEYDVNAEEKVLSSSSVSLTTSSNLLSPSSAALPHTTRQTSLSSLLQPPSSPSSSPFIPSPPSLLASSATSSTIAAALSSQSNDDNAVKKSPALAAAFASLRKRPPALKPLVWDKERSEAPLLLAESPEVDGDLASSSAAALSAAAAAAVKERVPLRHGRPTKASPESKDPSPATTSVGSDNQSISCNLTSSSLPWGPTGYADPTDAEVLLYAVLVLLALEGHPSTVYSFWSACHLDSGGVPRPNLALTLPSHLKSRSHKYSPSSSNGDKAKAIAPISKPSPCTSSSSSSSSNKIHKPGKCCWWRLDFPSTGERSNIRWNVRVNPSRNQGGGVGTLKNGDEIWATSVEVAGTKGDPETWLRIEMPSAKPFGGGGWTVMETQGGSWVAIGSKTTKNGKEDANIVEKVRMGRPPLSSLEKMGKETPTEVKKMTKERFLARFKRKDEQYATCHTAVSSSGDSSRSNSYDSTVDVDKKADGGDLDQEKDYHVDTDISDSAVEEEDRKTEYDVIAEPKLFNSTKEHSVSPAMPGCKAESGKHKDGSKEDAHTNIESVEYGARSNEGCEPVQEAPRCFKEDEDEQVKAGVNEKQSLQKPTIKRESTKLKKIQDHLKSGGLMSAKSAVDDPMISRFGRKRTKTTIADYSTKGNGFTWEEVAVPGQRELQVQASSKMLEVGVRGAAVVEDNLVAVKEMSLQPPHLPGGQRKEEKEGQTEISLQKMTLTREPVQIEEEKGLSPPGVSIMAGGMVEVANKRRDNWLPYNDVPNWVKDVMHVAMANPSKIANPVDHRCRMQELALAAGVLATRKTHTEPKNFLPLSASPTPRALSTYLEALAVPRSRKQLKYIRIAPSGKQVKTNKMYSKCNVFGGLPSHLGSSSSSSSSSPSSEAALFSSTQPVSLPRCLVALPRVCALLQYQSDSIYSLMCDLSDVLNAPNILEKKKRKRHSESDPEDNINGQGRGTLSVGSRDITDWGAHAATLIDAATKAAKGRDEGGGRGKEDYGPGSNSNHFFREPLTLQRYAVYSAKYKETPVHAAKILGLPLAAILRWNQEKYEGMVENSKLLKGTTLEILPDFQPLGALTKAASFISTLDEEKKKKKKHKKQAKYDLVSARVEYSGAAEESPVQFVSSGDFEFGCSGLREWKQFKCPVESCLKSYTHQRSCLVHEKMCVKC